MSNSLTARQIGVEVRAQMLRKGFTDERLATEVLDCSLKTARSRLAGETPFDFTELQSVAEALNTPLADLLRGAREVVAA